MMLPTLMLTIIWGTISTDGTITLDVIGGLSNSTTLICQRNATIVCQIDDYGTFMSWQIDSTTVIQCSGNRCANIAQPPSNIYFSSNTNSGLFSLTLSPVMKKDHGRIFRCNNHQIFKDFVAYVADVSTTTIFLNNSMEVTSGCVTNASYVEFHWYTTNDTFGDEEPYQANNLLTTNVSCLNDSICGEATTSRITKTLNIEETGKADRYIKLLVRYTRLNFSETIFSKKAYKLGGQTTTTATDTSPTSSTSTTTTTTTTTQTTTTTTETTTTASNTSKSSSSVTTTPAGPDTTQNPNESIQLFLKKYKFEAIAIGCSLIVILIALVCLVFVIKRIEKKRKEKTTRRALQLSDLN